MEELASATEPVASPAGALEEPVAPDPAELEFPDTLEGRISAYAAQLQDVEALGQEYLLSYCGSREAEVDAITKALATGLQERGGSAELDLADELAARVVEDFRADRVVSVNGWVLSSTECRLAALSVLVRGAAKPEQGEHDLQSSEQGAMSDPFLKAEVDEMVELEAWGPQSTQVGTPFLQQSDGHSAMWFRVKDPAQSLKVYVGGQRLLTTITDGLITVAISGKPFERLVAKPTILDVFFYDVVRNTKQYVGEFSIIE